MVKDYIFKKRYMLWYMLCFFALGVIDQRRGSADGRIQMAASNCVGIVIAAMLLPSVNKEKFKNKVYYWWTAFAVICGTLVGVWGWQNWRYRGQWITGVLNVMVWSYLVIYMIRERKSANISRNLKRPFFWCLSLMFLLMFFSIHEGILPLWMLFIFGGFYLLGIPSHLREDYLLGLLNGIIMWFFVQQTIAFGFRPYDYPRYRGLYAGETQNGIFYMMAYCAFLCKWLWTKEKGSHRVLSGFYFFMSAGSISFMLFTGGRSSLMGVAVVTFMAYLLYYIVYKKSFYKWLIRVAALGLCVVLLFPVVYGTIRYLPLILHHPIWFAGEYSDETSIRSFDPWNSDRYVSFEEAVDTNIGRILVMFGIDIHKWNNDEARLPWSLKVYAKEVIDPGSDPEHPYVPVEIDPDNSIAIRKYIYKYYFTHLNLMGHSKENGNFYFMSGVYGHAHNLLLQMAHDYGIIVGLLFLGLIIYCFIRLFRRMANGISEGSWIIFVFVTAIFVYGMTEVALIHGMITWALLYCCLCLAGAEE